MLTQFRQATSYAVRGKNKVVPFVSALHCGGFPSAVLRAIPERVVNSPKSKSVRACAHIGLEVHKGLPPFANGNAACAIVLEPSILGVLASAKHGNPAPISAGSFSPPSLSVAYPSGITKFGIGNSPSVLQTVIRHSIGLFNVVLAVGARPQPALTAIISNLWKTSTKITNFAAPCCESWRLTDWVGGCCIQAAAPILQ